MITIAFSFRNFITFFRIVKWRIACIMISWWRWWWFRWSIIVWKISSWTYKQTQTQLTTFNKNDEKKKPLTNTSTTYRPTGTIMIIGCSIWCSVRSILILFRLTVSWIIIFGTRSSIQRTTLRVNTCIATLKQKKKIN